MANKLYPKGATKMMSAAINFTSDTIKVALVSNAYTYSAAHEFLTDLGATRIGTDQAISNKTVTDGVFDGDDAVFPTVASGSTVACWVIYKDTGVAGTSPLLMHIDTGIGLPMTTHNGDITTQWSSSASKILSLVS